MVPPTTATVYYLTIKSVSYTITKKSDFQQVKLLYPMCCEMKGFVLRLHNLDTNIYPSDWATSDLTTLPKLYLAYISRHRTGVGMSRFWHQTLLHNSLMPFSHVTSQFYFTNGADNVIMPRLNKIQQMATLHV